MNSDEIKFKDLSPRRQMIAAIKEYSEPKEHICIGHICYRGSFLHGIYKKETFIDQIKDCLFRWCLKDDGINAKLINVKHRINPGEK